ncbi:MAG: glycosyltransferase [Deltaproteobacteria bacterium]|nr:glycosyltransferase [Deltaproteobacteria bacterium]
MRIGDRFYRVNDPNDFDIKRVAQEPALWIGNEKFVHFAGIDAVNAHPSSDSPIDMYWDGEVPLPFKGRLKFPDGDIADVVRATDTSLGLIADANPFRRLHAEISLVRRDWAYSDADALWPTSLLYLKTLRSLGPQYLQQGIKAALGLHKLPPSLWPADWENKLLSLLNTLDDACGIKSIAVDPLLEHSREQRVFASRLRYRLEVMPENCNYHHLHMILGTGDLFRIPVRVEGETLIIEAQRLLSDKPYDRSIRPDGDNVGEDFPLPNASRMALDGIRCLAKKGIGEAREQLERVQSPAASHYASEVHGYRTLYEMNSGNGTPDVSELPFNIGLIRGGFGPGGASQEAYNLLTRLDADLVPRGASIFVASGYFHPQFPIPSGTFRADMPAVDRATYYKDITRHIFDPDSEIPAEELQRRYDTAVQESADAISQWILQSGLNVLLASQMANPFENPITFPALLAAKHLVEAERGKPFPIVFRHNYFRDPEGKEPRIALWGDRHPNLDPNAPWTLNLVDGPANQRIALEQYGIETFVLPEGVPFLNVDTLFPQNGGDLRKVGRDEMHRIFEKFETIARMPRAEFRRYLREIKGLDIPEDAVLILSPSRISSKKRPDVTLRLAKMIQEKLALGKEVHLLLLGEVESSDFRTPWSGDQAETVQELRTLAEELGFAHRIHFLGFVSHERSESNPFTVTDIMRSVDIVSQMTEEETFCRTPLESISIGAPIALAAFNYPGKSFGQQFPVYQYIYASFNIFVKYLQEDGIHEGMVARITEMLENDEVRREMVYRNFFRAYLSPFNETYTMGYYSNLLSLVFALAA